MEIVVEGIIWYLSTVSWCLQATYDLAEQFNAPQLGKHCVLYALEHYKDMVAGIPEPSFHALMKRMVPKLKESLTEQLMKQRLVTVWMLHFVPAYAMWYATFNVVLACLLWITVAEVVGHQRRNLSM
jgi:hypothetical protein